MTHRKTILVVDDIPLMRAILARYVKTLGAKILSEEGGATGIDVIEAASGEAALTRLRKDDIDLVFLDLMMPDMDGLTFLSLKQKEARIRSVPVVVCSALGEQETVDQARELGAVSYIVKPFTLQAVEEKFREALMVNQEYE